MLLSWTNPNLKNAPPGWEEVDKLLGKFTPPARLGFVGKAGDLNRFWSRYRLAKSFESISIKHFVPDTVRGYSALFRVFLTWSAFEHLMRITGHHLGTIAAQLAPYDPAAFQAAIRAVPDHDKFLKAVHLELDRKPLQINMALFRSGAACNVLTVPAAIRHIFAHGKLTPNSGVGNVGAACAISKISCEFLFKVMDGEFTGRLRANGIAV